MRRRKDIAQIAFEEVKRMLVRIASRVAAVTGQEVEELIGEAYLSFMVHIRNDEHDPDLAKLSSWLYIKVNGDLLTQARNHTRRVKRLPREDVDLDKFTTNDTARFDIEDFKAGLSTEAADVVDLVFRSPKSIEQQIRKLGGPEPKNIKLAISHHLIKRGWKPWWVRRSFEEIGRKVK